jgi:hypothetical protein
MLRLFEITSTEKAVFSLCCSNVIMSYFGKVKMSGL